jgi:hypothetical protein
LPVLIAAGFATGAPVLTMAWSTVPRLASAGSSACPSVGESFPFGVRALSLGPFCAPGMEIGGVAGPRIVGGRIGIGGRASTARGDTPAALPVLFAGIVRGWRALDGGHRSPGYVAVSLSGG